MSPVIWLVLLGMGSVLLVTGIAGAVLGWLPLAAGIALAAAGGMLETLALVFFIRSRKPR